MATSVTPGIRIATNKPSAYSSCIVSKPGIAFFSSGSKTTSWAGLNSSSQTSSVQPFFQNFQITSAKPQKFVTKALSEASSSKPASGLLLI